jgi:hypothetical protein
MFAFFMGELRDWRARRMARSLSASAVALSLAAAVGLLQPLVVALAATAVFVLLGWAEGNRYRPGLSARRLLLAFPAGPWASAAGKALSSLALWLLVTLILSPLLAASAIAWGLPAGPAAACLLCWLAAFLGSASAGFLSSILFEGSDGFLGLPAVAFWLFSPIFIGGAAPFNPFVQAWTLLKPEGGASPFIGAAAELLAAAGLFAASAAALARARRRPNA